MDLLAFNSLADSAMRVGAQLKVESAWTAMIAAQSDSKTMKGHLKPWVKLSKGSANSLDGDDLAAALGQGGLG